MGDEHLAIEDEINRQQVSNLDISDTTGANHQNAPTDALLEVKANESKPAGTSEPDGGNQVTSKVSEGDVGINNVEGQSTHDNFFRIHRTKIGLMILIFIFIGIVIGIGVGTVSYTHLTLPTKA